MSTLLKKASTILLFLATMKNICGARQISFSGIWRDVVYSHCVELTQNGFDIESQRMSGVLGSMWQKIRGAVSPQFGIGRVEIEIPSATSSAAVSGRNIHEYAVKMVGSSSAQVLLLVNTKTNVIEHEYVRDNGCFSREGVPNEMFSKKRKNNNGTRAAKKNWNKLTTQRRRLSATESQQAPAEEIWRPTTSSSFCVAKNSGALDGSFGENLVNGSLLSFEINPIVQGVSANLTLSLSVGELTLRLDRSQQDANHVDMFYEDGNSVFADGVYLKKLDALETAMYCNFDANGNANTGTGSTVRRLIGAARLLGGIVKNRLTQVFSTKKHA